MGKILLLTRREVGSYFASPVAYVAMALFLAVTGLIFALWDFYPGAVAAMQANFNVMMIILVLILPILTMRTFAEEWRTGTLESLLTAPVTDVQVVLAKFLGSWLFYLAMLTPTLVYLVILRIYGNPEYGPVISGYLGLALLGALYIAIGILASSATSSQVIAAVVAVVVLILLVLLAPAVESSVPPPWRTVIHYASIQTHYKDFTLGLVDVVHVIYFVAVTAWALFFTVKILESRRWR